MALIASLFFGLVPMFLFAAFVFWLDRYEKEPKALLGATFFWGMVIAAGGAFIINTAFGIGIYIFTGSEVLLKWAPLPSLPLSLRKFSRGLRSHRFSSFTRNLIPFWTASFMAVWWD